MGKKHVHPPTFFGFCPLLFFLPVFPLIFTISTLFVIPSLLSGLFLLTCSPHHTPRTKRGKIGNKEFERRISLSSLLSDHHQIFNFLQHFDFYWLLYGRAYQLGTKVETNY